MSGWGLWCRPLCTTDNIQSPALNLLADDATEIANNVTFQGSGPADRWVHSSAVGQDSAGDVSNLVRRNAGSNGYGQIQSTNWDDQEANITVCEDDPGNSFCYQWQGPILGDESDFTLYSVAEIDEDADCGSVLTHRSIGSIEDNICPPRVRTANTVLTCSGAPPRADIQGPFTVCEGERATFGAEVTFPHPSVDTHDFLWSVSGGNGVGQPVPSGPESISTEFISTTIDNVGAVGDFTLSLSSTSRDPRFGSDSSRANIRVVSCPTSLQRICVSLAEATSTHHLA